MGPDDRFDLVEADVGLDPDQVQRMSSYKTVEAFAGITKRRLFLRDGTHAHTDGYDITVPLSHPASYKMLGHQLAHVLFQTNPQARKVFIEEYTVRAAELVEKHGSPLTAAQKAAFADLVKEVVNSIECHRVESLWGLLYSGSYLFGRKMAREEAEVVQDAHESFRSYLSVLEAGCNPPSGRFDRFRPYCVEAFRKSERRGPNATLVVSKWLITHLVSEILREARDQAPQDANAQVPDVSTSVSEPGLPGPPKEQELDDDSATGADPSADKQEGGKNVGNSGQAPEEDVADGKNEQGSEGQGRRTEHAPEDAKDTGGQSDEEGEPDDTPGSGNWSPPKTEATQKERANALRDLIDRTKAETKQHSRFNDVKEPPAAERGAAQAAAKMVSDALAADVNDSKALQSALDASKNPMNEAVQAARSAFRQQMSHDDWLRREADVKVVFRDVRARDVLGISPIPMSTEDLLTVQRLRAIFNRVMGRRRLMLEDAGTDIDPLAAIERRVTRAAVPVFQHEVRGQGFKILLLLDRSGSMEGERKEQAERACRIASRALRYPFVDLHIWGFQSFEPGQIDIVRFDPKIEVFDTNKSLLGGLTPLHLAIKIAHRFLERGSEMKHLFAVTDGFPVFRQASTGQSYSPRQLIQYVREAVQEARTRGITTTGAIIGNRGDDDQSVRYDLGPRELKFMFGPPRQWRQLHPDSIGVDLVKLVASSFMDFLNRV